jgi:hypothetical protein
MGKDEEKRIGTPCSTREVCFSFEVGRSMFDVRRSFSVLDSGPRLTTCRGRFRPAVSFLIIAVCLFFLGLGKPWAASEETVDKSPSPGGRNPFAYPAKILKEMALVKKPEGKPGAEAPTPAKMYTLSGILWTEKGGVASINQRILREGDTLDEYQVTRIEPGKVVLKKSDEEMVLTLFQSPVAITRHEDRFQVKKKRR